MRIWLVNLYFGLGTAPTGALAESAARELLRRGYQVEAVASQIGYNSRFNFHASRFRGPIHWLYLVWRNPEGLFGRLGCWANFYFAVAWFIFTRSMPDRVIVMTTPPFLHFLFVLRRWFCRHPVELVLWNQDTYPEILEAVGLLAGESRLFRCLLALERWSIRHLDAVLVLDQAMGIRLASHDAKAIHVVPNWEIDHRAIANSQSHPLLTKIHDAKDRFRFIVLYSGNYGWGHNLSHVLHFIERHPDQRFFYFVFVGGGEKWVTLEEYTKKDCESVQVVPYVTRDVYEAVLKEVHFGLVALDGSCVGLMSPSKIHSYLARGKPLIYLGPLGSNVAEAIETYRCGFIIDEQDANSWELFFANIVHPQFDYQTLAVAALQAHSNCYTEPVAVARFADVVSSIRREP